MSTSSDSPLTGGITPETTFALVGPMDSRRARRARSEAAAAALARNADDPTGSAVLAQPDSSGVVFSDEAPGSLHQRLLSIAYPQPQSSMPPEWAS